MQIAAVLAVLAAAAVAKPLPQREFTIRTPFFTRVINLPGLPTTVVPQLPITLPVVTSTLTLPPVTIPQATITLPVETSTLTLPPLPAITESITLPAATITLPASTVSITLPVETATITVTADDGVPT